MKVQNFAKTEFLFVELAAQTSEDSSCKGCYFHRQDIDDCTKSVSTALVAPCGFETRGEDRDIIWVKLYPTK